MAKYKRVCTEKTIRYCAYYINSQNTPSPSTLKVNQLDLNAITNPSHIA